jgi:hypothetical protein
MGKIPRHCTHSWATTTGPCSVSSRARALSLPHCRHTRAVLCTSVVLYVLLEVAIVLICRGAGALFSVLSGVLLGSWGVARGWGSWGVRSWIACLSEDCSSERDAKLIAGHAFFFIIPPPSSHCSSLLIFLPALLWFVTAALNGRVVSSTV